MWFGTKDGLYRYDGRKLKTYKSILNDSTSLSGNEIQRIFSDSNGNLWIAANGLHKYNFKEENFIRIQPPAYDLLTAKLKFISAFCEDKNGNLWLGTFGQGLYRFNPQSSKISYIKLGKKAPPPFKDYLIYSITFDQHETIWIASSGHQLTSININNGEQHQYYLEQKGDIQNVFFDRNGNLWLVVSGEPLKQILFDDKNQITYKSFMNVFTENFFIHLQDDIHGNLWLATESEGVFVFNPDKNEVRNFQFSSRDLNSISGNFIEDIFEDHSGNIWIATDKGVCKWSRWKKPFTHFRYDTEDLNSIGSSEVTGIDEDNSGNLWISTLNTGFSKLNLNTGKATRYDPSNSAIKSPWALEILSANDGTVWVATNFQHGLNHFNPFTGKLKEYSNDPENTLPF